MLDTSELLRDRKVLVIVLVVIVVIVSWSGVIDRLSREYVDASTMQALAAYAVARVINAAVSLAASISVSASFGVGFEIQPFQVLDPINDLVEQYSSVMKFAISSLIIQKLLVEIVSTPLFKIILTLVGAAFAASLYIKGASYSFLLFRVFAFFAMIRFLLVMVVMMNGIIDQAFVDKTISPQMQEVSAAARQLENPASEGGLSADEREALEILKQELTLELGRLNESMAMRQGEMDELNTKVARSGQVVKTLEAEMGIVERMNIMSRSEAYAAAREQLRKSETELQDKSTEIAGLVSSTERVQRDITNADTLLAGKPVEAGWWASSRSRLAEFRDMARWERIKGTVEEVIPTMLNLMAAFLFKTLILPLIFLVLFLKGFTQIWGMDPRAWVQQQYQGLRQ